MKSNCKLLLVMATVVLVMLAACGNESEGSNTKSNNLSPDSESTQNAKGSSSNKGLNDVDKSKTEDSAAHTTDTQVNDQGDSSNNTSASSNGGDSEESGNSSNEITENKKEEYLRELNGLEESDRNSEAKTTMPEMEEQEAKRYKNWDEALNEIYGTLKKQLSKEQMGKLKDEQRNWVKHRDEAAKEASLEYKGGSTESLEYVATQASLTKERSYALVANYMK